MEKIKTPKLELGFMRHGDPQESQKMVDFMIANDTGYFETCYFYLNWECEEYIYKLLTKYNRNNYELCGKMPVKNVLEHSSMSEIFGTQLKRVPGGYFDTYILQAVDHTSLCILKEKDAINFLLKEKQKGNIGKVGLSIQCLPETLEQYLKLGCWEILQMPLNYFDWYFCRADELYELAKKYNIPIIAQAPMKGGLLSKSIEKSPVQNRTLEQSALDFVVDLSPELILSGCSKLSTLKSTWEAIQTAKPIENKEYFFEQLKKYANNKKINCLMCNRCNEACPIRLPISTVFYAYNQALNKSKESFNFVNHLQTSIGFLGNSCIHCGQCLNVCPQSLNLYELFKDTFEIRA